MSPQAKCVKHRYRDAKEALAAMRYIEFNSTRERIPRRVYFCECCKGYHLTSKIRTS